MYINIDPLRARLPALDEAKKLIEFIRVHSHSPAIDAALDQITVLAQAHMQDIEDLPGKEYGLAPGEQKILAFLIRRRGKICTHEAILNVCSVRGDAERNSVRVRICTLRQKLPKDKYQIEPIWGVGYRMLPAKQIAMAA